MAKSCKCPHKRKRTLVFAKESGRFCCLILPILKTRILSDIISRYGCYYGTTDKHKPIIGVIVADCSSVK
jgi:hypothetical protein